MIGFCLLIVISLTTEQQTIEIEGEFMSGKTIYKGEHDPGIRVSELKHAINQYMNPSVISEPQYKFKFGISVYKFGLPIGEPFSQFISTDEYIALNPYNGIVDQVEYMQDVESNRLKGESKLIEAMVQTNPCTHPSARTATLTPQMVSNLRKEILEYFESPILTQNFDEEIQELIGEKIYFRHKWYPNMMFRFEIEQVLEIDESKKMDMKIVSGVNILEDHDSIDESLTVNVILEKQYVFKFLIWVDFPFNRWIHMDEYIELFPDGATRGFNRAVDKYVRDAQQIESARLKGESTLIEAMLLLKPREFRRIQSREEFVRNIDSFFKFSISPIPLFDQKIQDLVGEKIYVEHIFLREHSVQFEICEHV